MPESKKTLEELIDSLPEYEGDLLAVVTKRSEERGGIDKCLGLRLVKSSGNSDLSAFLIRNGSGFLLDGSECSEPPVTGNDVKFRHTVNPDGTFIESIEDLSSESGDYFVAYNGGFSDVSGVVYFDNVKSAMHLFMDAYLDDGSEYNAALFKMVNNEPILVLSNAVIQDENLSYKTTGFSCYDRAYNPYDTCSNGCKYCYANVGKLSDFRCLPNDLVGRVVIGSHTDPYQQCEKECLTTRKFLESLIESGNEITKLGVFTKCPLVVRDVDLLLKFNNPVVHFNLSPFSEERRAKLEPGSVSNQERIAAIKELKNSGIKVVVNVCPCMPSTDMSVFDQFDEAFDMADEICIGLTKLYGDIPEVLGEVLGTDEVESMSNKAWEKQFMIECQEKMSKWSDSKLVIWRDTGRKGWKNISDLSDLPQEYYMNMDMYLVNKE